MDHLLLGKYIPRSRFGAFTVQIKITRATVEFKYSRCLQ